MTVQPSRIRAMKAEQRLRRAVTAHTKAQAAVAATAAARDEAIRAAAKGMTLREIAAVSQLSFQRAWQITQLTQEDD